MAADVGTFLSTPLRRVLFMLGAYAAVPAVSGFFAAAVAVVVLRAGVDELNPVGTGLRIGAAVLGWELVTGLFWAARHWRGPGGLGTFLCTGRSGSRQEPGRWSWVVRWTRDTVALAAVVVGILLLLFPDEPSVPWAAAGIVLAVKLLEAGFFGSIIAVARALDRASERAKPDRPPHERELVPVEEILSRPDIAGQCRRDPRHAVG